VNRWLATALCLLLVGLSGGMARAADSAPACRVLTGARVHLPSGPVDDAVVVIVGDRIAAAGTAINGLELSTTNPASAQFQGHTCSQEDRSDWLITAGLIETRSNVGLVEVGAEDRSRDQNWEDGPANRAALAVADSYNARSSQIPIARLGGLTSVLAIPRGGLISGQGAAVDLAGAGQHDSILIDNVALYANLAHGSSRAASILLLHQALNDARFFTANKRAFDEGRTRPLSADPAALAAISEVVNRSIPLVVRANRAADIEALLRLAKEQKIRLVVNGGAEAWLLADQLAAAGVAVILDPMVFGPGSFDQIEARPDNAALLHRAGVDIIISGGARYFPLGLRYLAGDAVRSGLDYEAALAAVTSTPAKVFGLPGRGQIEAGAVANLVVWSSDPFELSSRPLEILVRGRTVSLNNRRTELRERYRRLPGSPVPPPPLPTP